MVNKDVLPYLNNHVFERTQQTLCCPDIVLQFSFVRLLVYSQTVPIRFINIPFLHLPYCILDGLLCSLIGICDVWV